VTGRFPREWNTAWAPLLLALSVVSSPVHGAEALAPRPLDARQWNERGNQFAERKEWQSAIEAFTEAIKLSPGRSELFVNRAVAYQRLGQWDQAEAECTTAIGINPEDTRAFLQRAITRTELGRNQEAFKDASRAARMEPDNAQCVFIRHLTASRLGRHDLGYTAGETYIGLREWRAEPVHAWSDPWSPYVALLNYVSLRRAGREAKAEAILAEAVASMSAATWPAPVILYLHGDLDRNTILSMANDSGRETLARYYIGLHEWLDGDPGNARAQFDWIVNHGDPSYLQFKLAGDHLKELKMPDGRAGSPSEK